MDKYSKIDMIEKIFDLNLEVEEKGNLDNPWLLKSSTGVHLHLHASECASECASDWEGKVALGGKSAVWLEGQVVRNLQIGSPMPPTVRLWNAFAVACWSLWQPGNWHLAGLIQFATFTCHRSPHAKHFFPKWRCQGRKKSVTVKKIIWRIQ